MRRRLFALLLLCGAVAGGVYAAAPYARAASLVVRAANLGGRIEALADGHARPVTRHPPETIPTRHGGVRVQRYVPGGASRRTTLLIPGIHSMGIEEPRLTALAADLAGAGVTVVAMALPDLQQYRIRPQATDIIEDAIAWSARREELAPDGRVGVVGVSFAGGLSLVAAGRPPVRDRVAFVVSFGGHGDLRRVLRYLATGEAPRVDGLASHPPHDYGVAVLLYGLADSGLVPAGQATGLREGVYTFLHASQLTLVDMNQANAAFARAREMAAALPEPARTYLTYVNDRDVGRLGPVIMPYLERFGAGDAALSPEQAAPPAAPVYLLHGAGDTVIPTAESALLARHLRAEGVDVHLLVSGLITHAEVDKAPEASEAVKLITFWASVLRR